MFPDVSLCSLSYKVRANFLASSQKSKKSGRSSSRMHAKSQRECSPKSREVFLHSPLEEVANGAVITEPTEVNQDPFHHSQFDHRFTPVTVLNVGTFPFCLTAPYNTLSVKKLHSGKCKTYEMYFC